MTQIIISISIILIVVIAVAIWGNRNIQDRLTDWRPNTQSFDPAIASTLDTKIHLLMEAGLTEATALKAIIALHDADYLIVGPDQFTEIIIATIKDLSAEFTAEEEVKE